MTITKWKLVVSDGNVHVVSYTGEHSLTFFRREHKSSIEMLIAADEFCKRMNYIESIKDTQAKAIDLHGTAPRGWDVAYA